MSNDWNRWNDQRPPNEPGTYRFRVTATILGKELTPEWTEKLTLCGMGYGEAEWWPLSPCHWDGYRRYMTADLEWRETQDEDANRIIWHGLDLLPCPFTGKSPRVDYHGLWIGAPPYKPKWLSIRSHLVNSTGWTSAKSMIDAWNTRYA